MSLIATEVFRQWIEATISA